MKEIRIFSIVGKAFVPKKLAPTILEQFIKSGYQKVPYNLFGMLFYFNLVVTYFVYFPYVFSLVKNLNPLIFLIITFLFWTILPLTLSALTILGIYFYLDVKIFNRSKNMEDKLGDYLTFVSTNLKGGMSFESSLWAAIRPEFGLLSEEMGMVSKQVMTGTDLVKSLNEFTKKYPSPIIRRSINLIVSEIEGGGKISDLIDQVVEDLKKTRLLKQEMAASTLTYIIFISAIIIVISPVLFSLSYQLLQVMLNFVKRFAGLNIQNMPISFSSEGSINPESFKSFSIFAISVISIFASMIISIIQKGSIKSGLKYIPMYWVSSILVYLIASKALSGMFVGLLS